MAALMKKLETISDMGSIKIFNDGLSCFFANGYGDGDNVVWVIDDLSKDELPIDNSGTFLGHFTVRRGFAFLSYSDCSNMNSNMKLYKFRPGRWFVHLVKPCEFRITRVDNERHS